MSASPLRTALLARLLAELTADERAAFTRKFTTPDAAAEFLVTYLRNAAQTQLHSEAYARADAAGRLYVARYWQHGSQHDERFLTVAEARQYPR